MVQGLAPTAGTVMAATVPPQHPSASGETRGAQEAVGTRTPPNLQGRDEEGENLLVTQQETQACKQGPGAFGLWGSEQLLHPEHTHPQCRKMPRSGRGPSPGTGLRLQQGRQAGCTRQWDPGDSAGADGQTRGQTRALTVILPFLLLKQPGEDFSVQALRALCSSWR